LNSVRIILCAEDVDQ